MLAQPLQPASHFTNPASHDVVAKRNTNARVRSLQENDVEPTTLLRLLSRAAMLWPTHGLHFQTSAWEHRASLLTYPELLEVAQANAIRLRATDIIAPRQCVVTYFDNHRDNAIWYWSIVAAGGIPALLSPLSHNENTRKDEIANLDRTYSSPTVLTTGQLSGLFKSVPSLKVVATESVSAYEVGIHDSVPIEEKDMGDDLATVLFTSGSTGHAKGVEYTHNQLVRSSKLKATFHKMDSTKTFMSWVSFDHSAALCEIHLHALYAGANQLFVPATDLVIAPERFLQAISSYRVSYTFAPNFFLAAVERAVRTRTEAEKSQLALNLACLEVIMCGGEANKTATLVAADELFIEFGAPRCSIKASYGLSETCSALFYNTQSPGYDEKRGYPFASAGKCLPEHELRLVDESGQSVAQGQSGAIQVKGSLVFKRYHNNSVATSGCMTSDGWFDTGDLGLLDEQGNLRIVGRTKEVMILNGQNYSPFELEHAIENSGITGLTSSYIASFSFWAEDTKSDSEDVVILFNPINDDLSDESALRQTIARINEVSIQFCRKQPYTVIPLPKDKLPKSTIGKLSRAKLKKAFQSGIFDCYRLAPVAADNEDAVEEKIKPSTPLQHVLSAVACEAAKIEPDAIGMNTAMTDLGLDSLGYIRFKSALEKALNSEEPLSMSRLLACKTLQEVDTMLLSMGKTTAEYDPIIPLVSSGSKVPLILCHPGGGEFLTWIGLLPYVPDRKIFALRIRGFNKNEGLFDSLEQMLDVYEEGIKKHVPNGPYAFIGLCFGGMLSFELAKRFEAKGEHVAFCGGLDNPPSLFRIRSRQREVEFFLDLLNYFKLLDDAALPQWKSELASVPDEDYIPAVFSRFPPGILEALDLSVAKVKTWQRINDSTQTIAKTYTPAGTVSKYDVFWVDPIPMYGCTDREYRFDNEWLGGWKNHVDGATQLDMELEDSNGTLRFHHVAGHHFTMLEPPNLEVFANAFNRALVDRGL